MMLFAIATTAIVVVVCAFLFLPLWFGRHSAATPGERKTANLDVFRDQLADLERDHSEGTLAEADFLHARQELQRRLLEEVEPGGESAATVTGPSRKTAIGIVLLLPVSALLAYSFLGQPAALDPARTAPPPAQAAMTQQQIDAMVAGLAEKMKANPGDMQGWLMLARSYRALGRYAEAAEAYGKAESVIADQPDLLAAYAETLAMASSGGLAGKPRQLVEQALKIDPKHGHSLFLAGAAAMDANDNKQGIAYWEALLPQVEPGSDLDQMLRGGIEKMRQGS